MLSFLAFLQPLVRCLYIYWATTWVGVGGNANTSLRTGAISVYQCLLTVAAFLNRQ